MFTHAGFRALLPEFTDPGAYPDASIDAWLAIAAVRLDPVRWDVMYDYGVSLFVAHYLTLSARQQRLIGRAGGGELTAPAASKSVGPVSVSFDISAVVAQGASTWNQTRYGAELYVLMGQVGVGGVQVDSPTYPGGAQEKYGYGYFYQG